MGVIYYTPVVDEAGALTDLTLAYLNPAAQRLTRLPTQPDTTYRQYFPNTDENGAWDFHRRSWSVPEPQHFEFSYEAPGFDHYFRVEAQRLAEGLLVIFTDTQAEVRSQVEVALLESQARERQAQAESQRQQLLLRQIFEHVPMPLALFEGPHHLVELANPALAALWGRPVSEVVGKPVFEALPDLRGQGFDKILAEVLQTGQPFQAEEVPAVLAREHLGLPALGYFNVSYQALRDPSGAPATIIIASAVEVTSQVLARCQGERLNQEAEAARAEAERQRGELERVFEQAPLAIAVYQGSNYTIQLANSTVARLWGRTRAQLLGKGLFEALPEVAGMGYEELLDGVMATGEPYVAHAMEARHERNGRLETVYWDFVYVALSAADGTITGAMVVATEVTEQVRARQQVEQLNQELEARVRERTQAAEQALALAERQRQRLVELVEQAPAALCIVTGPDLVYEAFNPLYASMFGGRPQVGRPMSEVLPEVVNHPGFLTLRAVYANGRPIRDHEVLVPLARPEDGVLEDRYFDYTQQPRYTSQGQIDGVFVFAVEVTDQVLARRQVQQLNQELTATNADLQQSNQQLTRTNVDLDNFIYTASHDLKAPITNIEGLLLALEHELPAAGRTGDVPLMLTLMQEAVDRFRRTIDHLTDLSRLQKEYNPAADAVALAPVVEAVRLDLTPLLAQTQGRLAIDIPAGLTMTFAEKNLRSVVYNLLSNAFKYHHPGRRPEVALRGWLAKAYTVLEVRDNGLGLDLTRSQDKLFAMFQRLHTHVEGTGVGLYMVRRMLENAGGRIEVDSQLGQGATFRAYFPR